MARSRRKSAANARDIPRANKKAGREGGKPSRGELDEEEEAASISQYELQRQERIKRNEAFIAALSINTLSKSGPPPAAKRSSPAKRPSRTNSRPMPSRVSKRLRGESVETNEFVALPGTWIGSLANATTKPGSSPPAFRHDYGPELNEEEAQERMEVLKGQIDARDDAKAGTASYQHCLHRVRTMSDAQLGRRVRTIERARGSKAKEKMLVFSHVLRAKGKTELLEMAEAALDRLVRGVPMPENES